MWTPPTMWNHLDNIFKHQKLKKVSNYKSRPKKFEITTIGVEEGVDPGPKIKDYMHLDLLLQGGTLVQLNVV